MDSEILIAGGSLAGLACAIALKQLGHSPLVLEKSFFPRKKLCGEFLGPDALRALQRLGLLTQVQALAFGPIEQTLFYNRQGKAVKIRHAWMDRQFPYGLALSRDVLDTLLMDHARALGVAVVEGQRIVPPIRVERETDRHAGQKRELFQVCVQTRGEDERPLERYLQSQWLVDATGRSGKLALESPGERCAPLRASGHFKRRIGLQCHVELPEMPASKDLRMFLFSGGYAGIQPLGEGQANLCMMVDAALGKCSHLPFAEFIHATVGQNPAARAQLRHAELAGGFCATADINLSGEAQSDFSGNVGGTLLRIGDACITVDPFTGSGMAHALETGQMAAYWLHHALKEGWSYQRMVAAYQGEYNRRFGFRLQWMRYFRPLLENGHAQAWVWPFLSPLLPVLAKGLR